MIIAGVILIVIAAAAAFVQRHQGGKARAARTTETLSCADIPEEWIIRPGARLYVHGEVSDATGRVAFAKPAEGRYIISTRSEEEIVGAAERNATIATGVGGVLALAGVVLVILGLVL